MTDNSGTMLETIAETIAAWHAMAEDARHNAKWWQMIRHAYYTGEREALRQVATYIATLQAQVRDQAREGPPPAPHEEDV